MTEEAGNDNGNWVYENQKTIADNQIALDQKLSNLEKTLKEALTPKEIKEEEAKNRQATLRDLDNFKEETAKSVEAKLEQRESAKQASAHFEQEVADAIDWAKNLAKDNDARWTEAKGEAFNAILTDRIQTELKAAKKENRIFNWDYVHEAVQKKFAAAFEWDIKKEEGSEEESTEKEVKSKVSKEEVEEKPIKPGSLTGLSDEIASGNIKASRLDELEKALASGKIKDYDELTRLHEQVMDVRNQFRQKRLAGGSRR